jgi:hypothetical protein
LDGREPKGANRFNGRTRAESPTNNATVTSAPCTAFQCMQLPLKSPTILEDAGPRQQVRHRAGAFAVVNDDGNGAVHAWISLSLE